MFDKCIKLPAPKLSLIESTLTTNMSNVLLVYEITYCNSYESNSRPHSAIRESNEVEEGYQNGCIFLFGWPSIGSFSANIDKNGYCYLHFQLIEACRLSAPLSSGGGVWDRGFVQNNDG